MTRTEINATVNLRVMDEDAAKACEDLDAILVDWRARWKYTADGGSQNVQFQREDNR